MGYGRNRRAESQNKIGREEVAGFEEYRVYGPDGVIRLPKEDTIKPNQRLGAKQTAARWRRIGVGVGAEDTAVNPDGRRRRGQRFGRRSEIRGRGARNRQQDANSCYAKP